MITTLPQASAFVSPPQVLPSSEPSRLVFNQTDTTSTLLQVQKSIFLLFVAFAITSCYCYSFIMSYFLILNMQKQTVKPALYSKQIGHELIILTDFITDVYNEFEKLSWSNNSQFEIGFFEKDMITKSSVFFGIWYELWNHFEIPLSIVINYKGKAPVEKHQSIKRYIESKKIKGIIFKDYSNFAVILFDYDFFNYENDVERTTRLFEEITQFLGINNSLTNT
ncbi:hypothetical protein [Ferruginibacter sp. SUN106]|uniref:hypothetical protein n=1 Tax=Ferruginibacter sp. SUN106 TaxID=2978348 RepID=UPI003D35CF16